MNQSALQSISNPYYNIMAEQNFVNVIGVLQEHYGRLNLLQDNQKISLLRSIIGAFFPPTHAQNQPLQRIIEMFSKQLQIPLSPDVGERLQQEYFASDSKVMDEAFLADQQSSIIISGPKEEKDEQAILGFLNEENNREDQSSLLYKSIDQESFRPAQRRHNVAVQKNNHNNTDVRLKVFKDFIMKRFQILEKRFDKLEKYMKVSELKPKGEIRKCFQEGVSTVKQKKRAKEVAGKKRVSKELSDANQKFKKKEEPAANTSLNPSVINPSANSPANPSVFILTSPNKTVPAKIVISVKLPNNEKE